MTPDFDYPLRPHYQAIEMGVVQEPDGRWRVFVLEVMDPLTPPNVLGCREGAFELPTLPDRDTAIELGCIIAWNYIDTLNIEAVYPEKEDRKIDVLD